MFSDEQTNQIKQLIKESSPNDELTRGQKYQIALMTVAIIGGLLTFFGVATFGATFISMKNISKAATERLIEEELDGIKLQGGMIVAFKLKDGCPDGWEEYAAARGRTIIGVVPDGFEVLDRDQKMTFQDQGGSMMYRLKESEMPAHKHEYPTYRNTQRFVSEGQSVLSPMNSFTRITGSNKPHSNMQPYVALHYCEKVS